MSSFLGTLEPEKEPIHTVHELYEKKLFASKIKNSLFVVAATYSISALGAGQSWNSMVGEMGTKSSFALAVVFCLATIFATTVHSFFTGIVGIVTVQVLQRSINKGRSKNQLVPRLVLGFTYLFFGAWFGVPILMLAFWSKSLTLAWLLFHLALTSKENRMISYIENGSTSFALVMISLMSAMGNVLTLAIALVAQVGLLSVVNAVASTRLYHKSDLSSKDETGQHAEDGIDDDRVLRFSALVGATLLVVVHFVWLRYF